MSFYSCPICDYPRLTQPPRLDKKHSSFEICPRCAFQFGVTDHDLGISDDHWRKQWLKEGKPWRTRRQKPFQLRSFESTNSKRTKFKKF
jgi:ribosome-binding protein aMBF1 (putative translation factor)